MQKGDGARKERRASVSFASRMPNTAFAVTLGLSGQSILWKILHTSSAALPGPAISEMPLYFFWFTAASVAFTTAVVYVAKAALAPSLVLTEWRHPQRVNFFAAPHLALLKLALGVPSAFANVAARRTCWVVACVLQVGFTSTIYSRWFFSTDGGNLGKESQLGIRAVAFAGL